MDVPDLRSRIVDTARFNRGWQTGRIPHVIRVATGHAWLTRGQVTATRTSAGPEQSALCE